MMHIYLHIHMCMYIYIIYIYLYLIYRIYKIYISCYYFLRMAHCNLVKCFGSHTLPASVHQRELKASHPPYSNMLALTLMPAHRS